MIFKENALRNFILVLSFAFLSFGLGFRLGERRGIAGEPGVFPKEAQLINKENPSYLREKTDFSLFWDVWKRLETSYIDKDKLDPQTMVYGAIGGLVSSLKDPYTVFLSPEENKESKDDLGGKFEGIGAQLGVKDNRIVVIAPLDESPAKKAGLKAGDFILKVNDEDALEWSLPYAVSKIRGPKGSFVKLTVLGKDSDKPSDVSVKRDTIKVASVEWKSVYYTCEGEPDQDNRICSEVKDRCPDCIEAVYFKLSRFGTDTQTEWNKAVEGIAEYVRKNKVKGLVFDLRNNPGGYLTGSVFVAGEFLDKGLLIVMQKSSDSTEKSYISEAEGKLKEIPLSVLINKGSASASEIVAGALQHYKRADIVGEASFGKGSIQEALDLPLGAGLHITTAKWLLPEGKWINGEGIKPDIEISPSEEDPDDKDVQLEKALERL